MPLKDKNMNLLKETIEELTQNGKTEADVLWVGNLNVKCTWNAFKSIADTEYNDGFGSPKVAQDLLIVGDNWWLERHEYDGSEWWEFKSTPKEPIETIDLEALTVNQAKNLGYDVCCGWENLLSVNGTPKY